MKHFHFESEIDGFYGAYWENTTQTDAALIVMLGDDPEDHMCKACVRWLQNDGFNVLSMSPAKKDYGHHNYPLERIETAIQWLKEHGNKKIGIVGASTTGMLALVAASHFPDITLTLAFTPSDFVWQGFMQGKKDGCKEWPIPGESTVSYHGKPIPYMPFVYQHPEYWHVVEQSSKEHKDLLHSRRLFDDSEAAGLLKEEHMIPVEKIQGRLVLVGAEDDGLWDTVKYIKRMEQRLQNKTHACSYAAYIYEHGTHFVFPQTLLRKIFPVAADWIVTKCFSAAKQYPAACRATRMDLDQKIHTELMNWKK